jgi:hypothetical protein
MVDSSKRAIGATDRTVGETESFEGLRGCYFMDKVCVNVDETGTIILLIDEVGVPDFVVDCLRRSDRSRHCSVEGDVFQIGKLGEPRAKCSGSLPADSPCLSIHAIGHS